jgi:hypothetical protein
MEEKNNLRFPPKFHADACARVSISFDWISPTQLSIPDVEMCQLHAIVHLHAMVSLCALPCVHLVHKSTGDRISLVTTVSCRDSK